MKLVIDISHNLYDAIFLESKLTNTGWRELRKAVKNGKPLPKGHGRLIDADTMWDSYHSNDYDFYEALDDAPTIIEADKENE